MLALILFSISLHTKFEIPSLTHSKDMIGVPEFNKELRYRRETRATFCLLCQLKCCPTAARITQTDRVSARGAMSATATFYSASCIVLYTHVYK